MMDAVCHEHHEEIMIISCDVQIVGQIRLIWLFFYLTPQTVLLKFRYLSPFPYGQDDMTR